MKIFRINKKYEAAFLPFFSVFPGTDEEDVLKFGALSDNMDVAGILAATISGYNIQIIALYVLPDFRRKGYGKALLNELSFLADVKGANAIQADFLYSDDAAEFFSNEGFDLFYSGEQYCFTMGDLKRSRIYKKYLKKEPAKSIVPISSIPAPLWNQLSPGAKDTWYDPDYSSVSIKNREITSCVLALPDGKDINITWLAVYSSKTLLLLHQLRQLTRKVEEMNPGDDSIRIRMCMEDMDLAEDVIDFLGGKGHVRSEGKIVSAIRLKIGD